MQTILKDVGKKTQGECFGELALKFDKLRPDAKIRRKATITVTEDAVFAVMSK